MSAARRRQRLDVAARREQLVALGLEVFGTRPYDAVSIEEVARAAGISKGLLYHYFSSKRDFYAACVGEAARRLLADTEPDLSLASDARLRAGVDAYLGFAERHGAAYAALMQGGIGADPEIVAIVDRTRTAIVERILADVDPAAVTPLLGTVLRGWVGFVETATVEWLDRRHVPRERLCALLTDVLVASSGLL